MEKDMIDFKKYTPHQALTKYTTLTKSRKCGSCGVEVPSGSKIGLIIFRGSKLHPNALACANCCNEAKRAGAEDIDDARERVKQRKYKLVNQAERLGIKLYRKELTDLNEKELTRYILDNISARRTKYQRYLNHHYKKTIDDLAAIFDGMDAFALYSDPYDYFSEYDEETDHDHYRWLTIFTAIQKHNGYVIKYDWATCTGDNSIEDNGFDVDNIWGSVEYYKESDAVEEIPDREVFAYYLTNVLGMYNVNIDKILDETKALMP